MPDPLGAGRKRRSPRGERGPWVLARCRGFEKGLDGPRPLCSLLLGRRDSSCSAGGSFERPGGFQKPSRSLCGWTSLPK